MITPAQGKLVAQPAAVVAGVARRDLARLQFRALILHLQAEDPPIFFAHCDTGSQSEVGKTYHVVLGLMVSERAASTAIPIRNRFLNLSANEMSVTVDMADLTAGEPFLHDFVDQASTNGDFKSHRRRSVFHVALSLGVA